MYVIVLSAILLVVGGAYLVFRPRKVRYIVSPANEEAHNQAQNALTELHRFAQQIFGAPYNIMASQAAASFAALGEPDRLEAARMLPPSYANLSAAHVDYTALMDGRTVTDGTVSVHTADSTERYRTSECIALTQNAERLRKDLASLTAAVADTLAVISDINLITATAAAHAAELEKFANAAAAGIDELADELYDLESLQAKLESAGREIRQAKKAIEQRNYLTARPHLESADRKITEVQEAAKLLPIRKERLELLLPELEASIAGARKSRGVITAAYMELIRRYSDEALRKLRTLINDAFAPLSDTPNELAVLRRLVETFKIDEAEEVAAEIETTLARIRDAVAATIELPAKLQEASNAFIAQKPAVLAAIGRLEERIRTQGGTQAPNLADIDKNLRFRVAIAITLRSRNPEAAMLILRKVEEDVQVIEAQLATALGTESKD